MNQTKIAKSPEYIAFIITRLNSILALFYLGAYGLFYPDIEIELLKYAEFDQDIF